MVGECPDLTSAVLMKHTSISNIRSEGTREEKLVDHISLLVTGWLLISKLSEVQCLWLSTDQLLVFHQIGFISTGCV